MSPARPARPPPSLWEWALCLLVVAGLINTGLEFREIHHLPQPFFFDVGDSLMDLYNSAFWAHQPGTYSVWFSIYPPISFIYLRFFSINSCYEGDPWSARDCDWVARYALYFFFLLNAWLLYRCFRRRRGTAIPRTLALAFGLPMLYGLDRGNLVIVCFTCYILAFGNGFGRRFSRVKTRLLMLALALNFKPYILVTVAPRVLGRRWRWLSALAVVSGGIYVFTCVLQGGGTPWELIRNAQTFVSENSDAFWQKIYYSTSYGPLLKFANSDFPFIDFVGSKVTETLVVVFTWSMRLGVAAASVAYLAALFFPRRVRPVRLAAMTFCLMITLTGSNGGYAQIFLYFLIFSQQWKGRTGWLLLGCVYLLCIPFDYTMVTVFQGAGQAWWAGREVFTEFGVSIGQFLRPALQLIILYSLAWYNTRDLLRGLLRHLSRPLPHPVTPLRPSAG